MEFFIRKAVIQALDKFVETDFGLVLNLFSSGNTINLENVQLKKTAIPSSFPVKVVQGILGKVSIALPLFHLSSRTTEIFIEDVSVVLEFKKDNDVSREDLISRLRKRKDTLRREVEAQFIKQLAADFVDFFNSYDDLFAEDDGDHSTSEDFQSMQGSRARRSTRSPSQASDGRASSSGTGLNKLQLPNLPGFVKNLLGNIKIHVGNVHVRIEQAHDSSKEAPNRCEAIGICLQAIDVVSCNAEWQPGRCPSPEELFKLIRIHRLGCYVESEAPRAHLVPFKEVRNGRSVRVPTQLVSYFPHTWLLEPTSLTLRLAVRDWWPAPPKPYRPNIFLRVFVSPIKMHLHSVFIRTLAGMVNELDTWKQSIEDKVRTMDALNARDTMSLEEHATRCNRYKDRYYAFIHLTVIEHGSKSQKKKRLKALRAAEADVHLDDLASIWLEVLHRVHREDQSAAQTQQASSHPQGGPTHGQHEIKTGSPPDPSLASSLPSARPRAATASPATETSQKWARALGQTSSPVPSPLGSLASWDPSPPASPRGNSASSKPGLSRMFSVSQLNAAQHDHNDSLRFAALEEASFAISFDMSICVQEIEVRVSLSKFSDNAVLATLGTVAFSLRDHSSEDLTERRTAVDGKRLAGRISRPPQSQGLVIHVLEARALRKAQATYVVIRHKQEQHKTKTFSKVSNPIWNQGFHFTIPDLMSMRRIDIDIELWAVRDLQRDELVGSAILSFRTKHLRVGEMVDRWVELGGDGSSVHLCLEQHTADLPFLEENKLHAPRAVKLWPGRPAPTLWLGLWLGKVQLRSIATIETLNSLKRAAAESNHSPSENAADTGTRTPRTPGPTAGDTDKRMEVRDISLLRIEEGTNVLVIADRESLWAKVSQLFGFVDNVKTPSAPESLPSTPRSSFLEGARAAPASAHAHLPEESPGVLVDVLVQLAHTSVLFSRWQILFLLNQFQLLYLSEQSPTLAAPGSSATGAAGATAAGSPQKGRHGATSPVVPPFSPSSPVMQASSSATGSNPIKDENDLVAVGQRLRRILASNLRAVGVGDTRSETSSTTHLDSQVSRPWVIVTAGDLPFRFTCHVYATQVKAGFTWGDGSVSTFVGRAGEESKTVTYLVATEARISLHTYAHDESLDKEALRLTALVGSLGIMDSKRPDRPVLTRENHRNTDFHAQAARTLLPMVSVTIHMPYGWAYSLNFADRRALPPPDDLEGSLLLSVAVEDIAIETPALQYTLPALLGGIMPLVKLIEVPQLPSIAVVEFSTRFKSNITVYLAENIDSVYGSRAFYALTNLEGHYTARALESAEELEVNVDFGFGMCRLSRNSHAKSHTEMRRRRSSAEFTTTNSLPKEVDDMRNSRWKVSHRILSSFRVNAKLMLAIDELGEALLDAVFSAHPIVIYFWIQDMALLCSILLNFVNDGIALERQLDMILRFELPENLRTRFAIPTPNDGARDPDLDFIGFDDLDEGDASAASGPAAKVRNTGRSDHQRSSPARHSSGFGAYRMSSASMGSENAKTKSERRSQSEDFGQEASSREDKETSSITHSISAFPLLQVPFKHANANTVKTVSQERFLTLLAIIGHDDSPVLRLKWSLSWLWNDPNMSVGAQMALSYFNLKKAGWEPVLEPWHVHGSVITENVHRGLRNMKFRGAGVLAEEVMDIDISEEFVTTIVQLCIQGIRFLDQDSHGLVTSFYPLIDEEKKHRHGFELWNLTGETVLYQPVLEEDPDLVLDPRGRDMRLDCESRWDLNTPFEVLQDSRSAELGFWSSELDQNSSQRSSPEFMEDTMLPTRESDAKAILGGKWTKRDYIDTASREKKHRYIRIKFEDYDRSFQAYLVRVDRVGDYALRLGNGNVLRVSVGTRNGLVHKIKLLSTVSVANRTARDVWLSRSVNDEYRVYGLNVLRTMFCPLSMTDDELGLYYTVDATHDASKDGSAPGSSSRPLATVESEARLDSVDEAGEEKAGWSERMNTEGESRTISTPGARDASGASAHQGNGSRPESHGSAARNQRNQGSESRRDPGIGSKSRSSVLSSSGAELHINLHRIPRQKQTLILEAGNFLCAVEFEFHALDSMAGWIYLESGKRRDKNKKVTTDPVLRFEKLRPRWAAGIEFGMRSKEVRERRLMEKAARAHTLQAVQIVLKPLFAVSNLLPVPLLVSSVRRTGPRKDPKYVAPGGRYICDDTQIDAVQFKVPSEDTEWSLPIPLDVLAPSYIADRLRSLGHNHRELGPTLSSHLRVVKDEEENAETVLHQAAETVNAAARRATDSALVASREVLSRLEGDVETVAIFPPSPHGPPPNPATSPESIRAPGARQEDKDVVPKTRISGVRRMSTDKSLQSFHLRKHVVEKSLQPGTSASRSAKSQKKMNSKKTSNYGSDMAVLEAGRATHEEGVDASLLSARSNVMDAAGVASDGRNATGTTGSSNDLSVHEPSDVSFPLARRVHPSSLRSSQRRHVISVRLTLMFRQRVIGTREQMIEIAKNNQRSLLWEETINFMFDNIWQSKKQVPKKLYVQYIGVARFPHTFGAHASGRPKLLGIGCIDLAELLEEFSQGKLRRQRSTVQIHAISGPADDRTLVKESVLAEIDIDVRVLSRKAATAGFERMGEPGKASSAKHRGGGGGGGGRLDGDVVQDVEPDTDDEEFEVLSQVGSDVDSDVESWDSGEGHDEGIEESTRTSLLGNLGFARAVRKFGTNLTHRRRAEQEAIRQAISSQEKIKLIEQRLLGPFPENLEDHAKLDRILREFDGRRCPLALRCRISNAQDAGFRLSIHAPMWFKNESSVEAVVQSTQAGAASISVVPPKRSLLLDSDREMLQVALHRYGDKLSNVMQTKFTSPELYFKFKDVHSGRELLNVSQFVAAESRGAPNTLDTRVVKLWHSIYISNKTNVLLEFRATGAYRRMGSFTLQPELENFPWHYGSHQMQIRSRAFANRASQTTSEADVAVVGMDEMGHAISETVPSSDWSGLIDLKAEAFQENFVSLPIALFDTDGLPVRIIRIVVTRSTQAASTRFISFEMDDPPTYIVQNRSKRTIVVSQRENQSTNNAEDSLSVCENVLRPGDSATFGWTEPSQDRRQLLVRMVLRGKDKSDLLRQGYMRHISDDLAHAYKLDKVGKLKSYSLGHIELHANVEVVGSSRLIEVQCESTLRKKMTISELRKFHATTEAEAQERPAEGRGRRASTYSSLDEGLDGGERWAASSGLRSGHLDTTTRMRGMASSSDWATSPLSSSAAWPGARSAEQPGMNISPDDEELNEADEEHRYSISVHVLEARGIGAPRGQPAGYPRVVVHCGTQSNMTPEAEAPVQVAETGVESPSAAYVSQGQRKLAQGRPVGNVRWVHAPIRFDFDLVKPQLIRFEIVQPVVSGSSGQVRHERIGSVRLPIPASFYDRRDIAKFAPDWMSVNVGVAGGHQHTQLRFEMYFLTNESKDNQSVPRMLRVRMEGFGISIINSAQRREDLYGRVSGIDFGVQISDRGRISTTLRVRSLQVDNNQPLVQNRVCVVPTIKDVSVLELFFAIGYVGGNTVVVDNLQLVMQSLEVKIDEKFIDAILGVSKGLVDRKGELEVVVRRAKASVNGTFEGKRTTSFEFVEDMSAGETSVLLESDESGELVTEPVHRFFAGHSLQTINIASEVERILQSHVTLYVRNLHIYPIKITLSFFFKFGETDFITQYQRPAIAPIKGVIAGFGKWSDVVIRCGDVRETSLFADPVKIAKLLGTRYAIMLSKQSWKGIAALEILGNPQHFVDRVVGSLAALSTIPVQVFRERGLEQASAELGSCVASVMCTSVAAPLQLTWRVTGSIATILEGTRPIRHLGLPLRMLTTALQASQQGVEFFDPRHESVYPTRRPRTFNEHGLYEPIIGDDATTDRIAFVLRTHESDRSSEDEGNEGDTGIEAEEEDDVCNASSSGGADTRDDVADDQDAFIINVFDTKFSGLSQTAIDANAKSQFQINHSLHCCIMLMPGLNIIWLAIYILHCAGILEWF
ncbi:Vacuolar protein sorting-associated protein 13C [Hondaea fermentalgiana]|uniref:Vacuolar protein sorting-associated protein 13C n=1 Tax=Hondaea fermentalgiana TaxID=2315210 RepID=A0A2R5GBV0_9STRA|nr:Vacuolar protein sorting-associated protein 13C [Hondaea fermentalgiana]|eukprot:GBG26053.1 Vacuolar protein sorting-associated protein 13C [Hondaea fermentalgiana]